MTDLRRQLPSIDTLLAGPGVAALLSDHPRALVVKAARLAVEAARASGGAMPPEGWDAAVRAAALRLPEPSLAPVINATGVVLHTNLGRAPLAEAAIAAMTRVARGYAALEYDLGRGTRGARHAHCRDLLVELTRAVAGLVVNHDEGSQRGADRSRRRGRRRRSGRLQRRQAAGGTAGRHTPGYGEGHRGLPRRSHRACGARRQADAGGAGSHAGAVPRSHDGAPR